MSGCGDSQVPKFEHRGRQRPAAERKEYGVSDNALTY